MANTIDRKTGAKKKPSNTQIDTTILKGASLAPVDQGMISNNLV